jgi:hypothetical protein
MHFLDDERAGEQGVSVIGIKGYCPVVVLPELGYVRVVYKALFHTAYVTASRKAGIFSGLLPLFIE